ncbi:fructose-specific PTS system IIA component [Parolsenella catena]|uniref:Fructose-specific PTS system IIA component n=1 Tax=Parolsenella catena TaxID=2003188 RepID=A0A3G9KAF5_9ACTN|nr:fructose PTS transporter subunit IIA [Parolsenella catena]BBH49895.1 fructose-specific PTS system IIA component [Parolsenella catena]
MSGFVSEENILLNQQATTKEEALRTISDAAARIGVADDADAVYAAFLAREEIDKTGMVDGFAVPHCKTDAVKSAAVIIFKNAQPVEWPSLDDKPVDIAMALLIPDSEAGTTHLRLLSKAAMLLMDDNFKSKLRESDDAADLAATLNVELVA